MRTLGEMIGAVLPVYSALQHGTRKAAEEAVREKLFEAALLAAAQLALLLMAAALSWWTDGAPWSRLLLSAVAILCIGFNTLKLLVHDLPETIRFMNSWKKLWLDLMGINLFAIVVLENAGIFFFWAVLAVTRSSASWQAELLAPWLELL